MPAYKVYTKSGNNLTFVANATNENDLKAALAQANGSYVVIPDDSQRVVTVSALPAPFQAPANLSVGPAGAEFDRATNKMAVGG